MSNDTSTSTTETAQTVLDHLASSEGLPKSTKTRYEQQKAEGIVNPIVLAALVGVRPQMVYNYLRKGVFGDAQFNTSTQKKVISLEAANAWAQGYTNRKLAKAEQVERELSGEAANV
jgi:hypothetical protein